MTGFAHAAGTKGLLLALGFTSVIGSTFGRKYLFHLQLIPHITRDHQLWRLISRNLAFTSSIDVFISILLIYTRAIQLERRYGTVKFVSFAIVSAIIGTALEVVALTVGHRFGLQTLPAGPFTLVFSLLYTSSLHVPASYAYKVFGIPFTNRAITYLLSFLLVFASPPNSIVSAACGVLAGILYCANVFGSRQWRIPKWIQRLGARYLGPVLSTSRMPRRSTHAQIGDTLPDAQPRSQAPQGASTARQGAISEVVQTFASTRSQAAPPAEAVAQLRAMFPAASIEQVNSALQRGNNDVSQSVEYLLQ